jgi:hypothetical protein
MLPRLCCPALVPMKHPFSVPLRVPTPPSQPRWKSPGRAGSGHEFGGRTLEPVRRGQQKGQETRIPPMFRPDRQTQNNVVVGRRDGCDPSYVDSWRIYPKWAHLRYPSAIAQIRQVMISAKRVVYGRMIQFQRSHRRGQRYTRSCSDI